MSVLKSTTNYHYEIGKKLRSEGKGEEEDDDC